MDTGTKNRLRRKLMNAQCELDGIATMIKVNADDEDERKVERFLKETQIEVEGMADRIAKLFEQASAKL